MLKYFTKQKPTIADRKKNPHPKYYGDYGDGTPIEDGDEYYFFAKVIEKGIHREGFSDYPYMTSFVNVNKDNMEEITKDLICLHLTDLLSEKAEIPLYIHKNLYNNYHKVNLELQLKEK